MVTSILAVMFTFSQGDNRMVLAQFQLNENNQQVMVNGNIPNETTNSLIQQLNYVASEGRHQDVTMPLCE